MSGECKGPCNVKRRLLCEDYHPDCPAIVAHKPEPDEAAESARTSGSPTASRSGSVGTTAPQLAPVLRPAVGAASEGDWWCNICERYHESWVISCHAVLAKE
jgi:hypothetical protein